LRDFYWCDRHSQPNIKYRYIGTGRSKNSCFPTHVTDANHTASRNAKEKRNERETNCQLEVQGVFDGNHSLIQLICKKN